MRWYVLGGALAIVATVVLIFGFRGTLSPKPPLQIFPDMKKQPIYRPQGENSFFADHRDMRTPVTGTVAYGGRNYEADAGHPIINPDFLQADEVYYRGTMAMKPTSNGLSAFSAVSGSLSASVLEEGKTRVWVSHIPAIQKDEKDPRWQTLNAEILSKGRDVYNMTCALCHGGVGNGKGVTKLYGMNAANLHDDRIVAQPDGEIYNTIVHGKQAMKPYGHMIRPAERWAVVAYVRALQRSQKATVSDIPAEERSKLGINNP